MRVVGYLGGELERILTTFFTIVVWWIAGSLITVNGPVVEVAVDLAILLGSTILVVFVESLIFRRGATFVLEWEQRKVPLEGVVGPVTVGADPLYVCSVRFQYLEEGWVSKRLRAALTTGEVAVDAQFTPVGGLRHCLVDQKIRGYSAVPLPNRGGIRFGVPSNLRPGEVTAIRAELTPEVHQGSLDLGIAAALHAPNLGPLQRWRVRARSSVTMIRFVTA